MHTVKCQRRLGAFVFLLTVVVAPAMGQGACVEAGELEACSQLMTGITQLDWLSGCWESQSPGRLVEEHWMTPRGNSMLGMARSMRSDTLRGFELLILRETGNALTYEARPSGQAGAIFRATSVTDSTVVFENPEHDFPQRIGYTADGDSLFGWIDGTIDEEIRRITFPYRRVGCESTGSSKR